MEVSTVIRDASETEPTARDGQPEPLSRGETLDRYVVLDRVGAGGMGTVYAAFDPRLDRRVALKVLHPHLARRDPSATARLVREAQSLARLTHPGVVTVFDAGETGGRAWLAMEFVAGRTLKAWRNETARSIEAILACCVRAGEGLAAAHAQGLVHRDFKPDNVMVADDGRVLVMDFGLARPSGDTVESGASGSMGADTMPLDALTRSGAVLGTPAYMAPEVLGGRPADARSDQFSFCVAVWEALFGMRPFAGDTLPDLTRAVRAGELREPPDGVRVAARVVQALRRGLSREPDARFVDMRALLDALAQRPIRIAWRGWIAAGASITAMAALGLRAAAGPSPCEGGADRVAQVWNAERQAAIERAFVDTELPYAGSAWQRARPLVDAWTLRWAEVHRDVCEATRVRGEQSEARLDLRMDCLDEALAQAAALTDELAAADADLVARAWESAQRLPAPDDCAARTQSQDPADLDPAAREAIASARRLLATAKARAHVGRYATAGEAVDEAMTALGEVDAPALRGALLAERGRLQQQGGVAATAVETLREGLRVAAESDDARVVADLWLSLVFAIGYVDKRADEALALALAAELAVQRADVPALRMRLDGTLGSVLVAGGRAAEAVPHFERALAAAADDESVGATERAKLHNNYALALVELARWDDALREHGTALAIVVEALGDEHPYVAMDLANLGRVYQARGQMQQARDHFERALEIRRRVLGAEDVGVGESLLNLGIFNDADGRSDEAQQQVLAAKAIFEARLGAGHPYVALALLPLGNIDQKRGDLDAAEAKFAQAERILRAHYGRPHPYLSAALVNRGSVALDRGRIEEALQEFAAARENNESTVGAEHPKNGHAWLGTARGLRELGRFAEASAAAQRAVELWTAAQMDPVLVAEARFELARSTWEIGDDRGAAMALARQALDATNEAERRKIAAWLAERGP